MKSNKEADMELGSFSDVFRHQCQDLTSNLVRFTSIQIINQ